MAEDDIKVKKERDPIMMVCFIVFILTFCTVTGAAIYNDNLKADDTVAVNGSSVTVNYTGAYYDFYGNEHSVVFDTSQWSIANNDDVLKSNDFTLKVESSYTPLKFTIGGTEVIAGFGNSVIGHKVGDKYTVRVPAGEGYDGPSTEGTISAASTQDVNRTEVLTLAQFEKLYGYELKGYAEMEKSVYGWPASASYNTSDNTVTMVYKPVQGQQYVMVDNDYGKVALNVINVSSKISFTYSVSDYVVVSESEGNKEIQMIMLDVGTTDKMYIQYVTDSDNDGIADSFSYKTAGERYNQDLYFEIEIVSIG